MDERCAKTLDALSTFIQSQRALLAQTEDDIGKLKEIRVQISEQPDDLDVSHFLSEISTNTSRLSEQVDVTATFPEDFDWALFASQDPSPFKSLASSARQAYETRDEPKIPSTSGSSALLQLVRDRRRTIIDPVLASIPPLSSDEEDEPPDPEELRKIREREKIRELKMRKINGGGGFATLGTRKPRASDGVFIRTDLEDESAEVDIWGGDQSGVGHSNGLRRQTEEVASSDPGIMMDVDTPPTSIPSPVSAKSSIPPARDPTPTKSERQRRSSRMTAGGSSSTKLARGKSKQSAQADRASSPPAMDVEPDDDSALKTHDPPLDKKGKPRPETYKQAWSVSEQHLLERLLEEIPEGEKNRWAKISKAMDGRRTARQVASRVQKYYEKLKRFGLDVGKS